MLNPHWDDEKLYQTARRILSAVTQHITYHEFLPRLFGWDGVHRHGLTLQTEGYYQGQGIFLISRVCSRNLALSLCHFIIGIKTIWHEIGKYG